MMTPDLTNEFYPVPKPEPRVKKTQKAIKPGKRVTAWVDGLKVLKPLFEEHGITTCEIKFEGCLIGNFLGFAHVQRRVNYNEEELVDPKHVVLACQQCHYTADNEMPKKDSEKLLSGIVKRRAW